MLKENPKSYGQNDLFCARLTSIIDMKYELAKLSRLVEWESLADDLSSCYCADNGRPGGLRFKKSSLFKYTLSEYRASLGMTNYEVSLL